MHSTRQNGTTFLLISQMKDRFRLCSHSTLHSLQVKAEHSGLPRHSRTENAKYIAVLLPTKSLHNHLDNDSHCTPGGAWGS